MSALLRRGVPWLLAVTLTAACGSRTEVSPVDDHCARYAETVCPLVTACCASVAPIDESTCRQYASLDCRTRADAEVRAGKVFHADAAAACLASLRPAYDGCLARADTDPAVVTNRAACAGAWTGTLPLDARCTSDAQCAPRPGGVDCTVAGTTVKPEASFSVCTARAKVGEPCLGSGRSARCPAGAYCKLRGSWPVLEGECAPRVPEGGACETLAISPCVDGLGCDSASSTCRPLPGLGATCASIPPYCAAPYVCGVSFVCVEPQVAGATCRSTSDCATDLVCDPLTDTCRPKTLSSPAVCEHFGGASSGVSLPGLGGGPGPT